MINDMNLSADLNNKFQNYIKDNNFELGIDFPVQVLQVCICTLPYILVYGQVL